MHKGAITLQSAVGRGSTFGASLYLRQCVEAGEAEPTLSEGKPAQRTWVRNRMAHPRVLVAEDNVVNQKVVRKILEKRGYEVLVANNGLEALALLERESFDVVLMDVQMPELDGIVATRRIRANPRWQKLPIIAMTAHAMNGDRERCLNAGMDSYLSKPVSAAHLTATIDQWIREKSEPVEVEIPAPPSGVPEKVVAMGDNLQMFDSKNLMTGLTMLFLQVAPEHMQRIHSAVVREDWATLRNQSKRLERAAERISASSIASLASQIAMHAGNADLAPVQNLLMELEEELRGLEREMGEAEPERVAS
jgi:CheY-like chemotaxis protein/HPt (histidine-containing phosphotransfer) domain-containing protein